MAKTALLISLLMALLSASARADDGARREPTSAEPLAIDVLRTEDLQSLPYMCECEFFRGPINGTTTVFATRKERTVAFAMVDGRLVSFQRDGKPANSSCRKKLRYHERWVDGRTAVVLDYHVTGSGEESCWFEGEMSVTVGRRMASTSIRGACGC
jgi:hypothetical protein